MLDTAHAPSVQRLIPLCVAADNVIRPIVTSSASQVPFLVVMLGMLVGFSAFGAIGLFLGPVILSVLLSVWEAWLIVQTKNHS